MAEIEMIVDSIRVSLMNYQRIVILKEKEGERYLPIWIGPAEADSIAVELQGVSVPRPLTHDFICSVIDTLGGSVVCAVISKLENDCFYGITRLESDDRMAEIDCRPSDAIAVAIRANVPILAYESVLLKAGVLIDPETGKPVGEGTTYVKESVPKELGQVEARKLETFSTPVREIFARAEEQARQLNSKYVGTGHLLLALFEKAPDTASDTLSRLDANVTELVKALRLSVDEEQPSDLSKLALNDNAKRAIELGVEEARTLDSPQVLPGHLLVAMLREGHGQAGRALREVGVSVERVYAALIRLHSQTTRGAGA